MKGIVASMLIVLGGGLFAAEGVWVQANTGTTPQAATSYSSAANWQDGFVPGVGDIASFDKSDYSARRYIVLPASLSLARLNSKAGTSSATTSFLGSSLTLEGNSAVGTVYGNGYSYANISAPSGLTVYDTILCGDVSVGAGRGMTYSGGGIYYRLDQYANDSDRERSPLSTENFTLGNARAMIYAPASLREATTGSWTLRPGSPFLTRVSGLATEKIPVGGPLSGTGIPQGAFVRRLFPEVNVIEMSAPATVGSEQTETVTFGPFEPIVNMRFGKFCISAVNSTLYLFKKGVETNFRFEPESMEVGSGSLLYVGGYGNGWQRGTFVTHDAQLVAGKLRLVGLNVEFGENPNGTPGFPNAEVVYQTDQPLTLTVTNGINAVVSVFSNIVKTVEKDGMGNLTTSIPGTNSGTISVKEGTLTLSEVLFASTPYIARAEVSGGAILKIADGFMDVGDLVLANGAVLGISEGVVLTVESFQAEAGAVIEGPGTLAFAGVVPDLSGIVLKKGARVRVPGVKGSPVLEPVAGAVVGNPALWLKADDISTMTLDGENVLRWNDCRGTGYLFATNIVEKPTLVAGSAGNYVNFLHRNVQTHYLKDEQVLVWSDIVQNIRVVFAVIDPTDGGGYVLGRSSRIPNGVSPYCGTGGFFYRENTGWWKPIWSTSNQPVGSSIYLDGEKVAADATFREPAVQLVEIHLPEESGFMADALGSGYADGGGHYAANGNLRAHEYIVYTNELSSVERQKVAQYLMRKWLGHDAPILAVADAQPVSGQGGSDSSGGVEVVSGETVVVDSLGAGEFIKDGEGSLYAHELVGGNLYVAGGEAVIRSFALKPETLPRDESCYLHLDATVGDSLTTNVINGTNFVTRWSDVRGSTGRYYVTKPGSDIGAPTEYGWLHANVIGSKPMVDLGPMVYDSPADSGWGSPKPFRGLTIMTPSGSEVPGLQRNGRNGPDIRSIFMVYDSSGGGGALLAARGNSYPSCGLETWHDPEGEVPKAIFNYPHINSSGLRGLYSGVKTYSGEMSALIRQNGRFFDPWDTAFSGSQDVFVLSSEAWPRRTASFAIENLDRYAGGLMYGEVILYTNFVGQVETKQIEAYLLKKWKGVETPGYRPSALDRLTVDAGATVRVVGGAPLTVATLSVRGGSIAGPVKMSANSVLEIPVLESGILGAVTLGSDFDFSSGVTVRLVGNVDKTQAGSYTVVASTAIKAESAALWSLVDPGATKRTYGLMVVDGAVKVSVSKMGLVMIVR